MEIGNYVVPTQDMRIPSVIQIPMVYDPTDKYHVMTFTPVIMCDATYTVHICPKWCKPSVSQGDLSKI